MFIQAHITNRGEIIKAFGVFRQQRFHPVQGFLKLGILHLQLDMVDLQFMQQPLGFHGRAGDTGLLRPLLWHFIEPSFGLLAQCHSPGRIGRLRLPGGTVHS